MESGSSEEKSEEECIQQIEQILENYPDILLKAYTKNHKAPKTKESVDIPEMSEQSLSAQKKWLHDIFYPKLFEMLQNVNCETVDGNTQAAGGKLENLIENFLNSQGVLFVKASSQKPIDFRNVQFSSEHPNMFLESKKTNGTKVELNDSIPKRGSWYVAYSTERKRLIIILADVLLAHCEDISKLESYKRVNECLRHDFKTIGNLTASSRMGLSINLRRYFDSKQSVFWNIHEDPPPDLTEEKKKQKEKDKEEFEMGKDIKRLFK